MGISYFLGANSAEGFYSLYDELRENGECYLHIIKGGPGSGKSTFMRRIGEHLENSGYSVEYIRCSGDIKSLDAIYLPELHMAFADGTAPHVLEPGNFGANGDYIDLGRFSKTPFSDEDRKKLLNIQTEYRVLYKHAYSLIAAAKNVMSQKAYRQNVATGLGLQLDRILSETERNDHFKGTEKKRFITAISASGEVRDLSSLEQIDTVYAVDDSCGEAGQILDMAAEKLINRGHDIIKCFSPLDISCEAVIAPEPNVAFISSEIQFSRGVKIIETGETDIRAGERQSCKNAMLAEAAGFLAEASLLHAKMEEIGGKYIDFHELNNFTEKYLKYLSDIVA